VSEDGGDDFNSNERRADMNDLETWAAVAFRLVTRVPSLSDEELTSRLIELGTDRAIARRIVLFAPMAAARVEYGETRFPDEYFIQFIEGGRAAHSLRDEPVYTACIRVARARGAAGNNAMLWRSATYNVVRSSGRDPKNLQFGAPTLLTDSWPAPPETAPPRSAWQRLRCFWLARFG